MGKKKRIIKITMSRIDKEKHIPYEPKFDKFELDISLAIQATRVLSDFYKNISNMEKKKHVKKTLLNLVDALNENQRLEIHIQPFKVCEILAANLLRQFHKTIAKNQKPSKGMFFLYKYFQNYIYGKEKTNYFADGANVFRADRDTSLVHPSTGTEKIIRALGDEKGQLVYDFIFKDIKTMQEIFDKLKAICPPEDNRTWNTLRVHLTNYCLYYLYYHAVTVGGEVPYPLMRKSLILNELFEASHDYNDFFDAAEEILFDVEDENRTP